MALTELEERLISTIQASQETQTETIKDLLKQVEDLQKQVENLQQQMNDFMREQEE